MSLRAPRLCPHGFSQMVHALLDPSTFGEDQSESTVRGAIVRVGLQRFLPMLGRLLRASALRESRGQIVLDSGQRRINFQRFPEVHDPLGGLAAPEEGVA